MGKLLFFDIDGTLAYPRCDPSTATVTAIRQARRNGNKVFLCTGRTLENVPNSIMNIGFDGGIYSAGGKIVAENNILSNRFMPNALAEHIMKLLTGLSAFFALETDTGRFNSENGNQILSKADFSGASSEMQRFLEALLCNPNQQTISQYRNQPIYKIVFFASDHSMITQLEKALEDQAKVVGFANLLSDSPLIAGEISDPGIHKGIAMEQIAHYYGKTADDCIAFGDSMNDVEVLAAAGLGIAMGNAEKRVLDIADMVCDTCENDGVAKMLHQLHII